MFTATKDLMLPATVTGSWPRPRWYDAGLWARPLDTALLDVKFREQFLDAQSTVVADQKRAGLDFVDGVERAVAKAEELARDRIVEVAAGHVRCQVLAAGLI